MLVVYEKHVSFLYVISIEEEIDNRPTLSSCKRLAAAWQRLGNIERCCCLSSDTFSICRVFRSFFMFFFTKSASKDCAENVDVIVYGASFHPINSLRSKVTSLCRKMTLPLLMTLQYPSRVETVLAS